MAKTANGAVTIVRTDRSELKFLLDFYFFPRQHVQYIVFGLDRNLAVSRGKLEFLTEFPQLRDEDIQEIRVKEIR